MTIMNIVNLATRLTNSFDEGGSVGTVVNSMMISRFLLSLRQAAYSTPDGAMDTLFSFGRASDGTDVPLPHSLHFASFVGNMGVELDWEADGEDRQESDFTVLPP
ncbi:hypothetical protein CERSUDRAFT_119951 [Gelatoporia subvermispora B]|uniref:Uncharacterized protein n=1 Tax=Ceriporiopsis subvermispora (strain B) TaxID=914234 RepID=M2QGT0_CERS8|nr:hypothetical protein CERSUDRAFT_119951 [Gelatoporia subvermispora B]